MATDSFMWTLFCDDVRQEVGNKLSFVGVYGPNLVVPAMPTSLLKLCCVMMVRVPAKKVPKSIEFRVLRDQEELFAAEVPEAALHETVSAVPTDKDDDHFLHFHAIAQFVNLPLAARCLIQSRATVDGEELKGGSLVLTSVEATH